MKTPSVSQKEAIIHNKGPAILFAGPGSGKTFTVISRINYLIQKEKIPPENILVVTFSKAAAKEMQNRFFLESKKSEVHFGTFHSLAYFILRSSFNFSSNSLISDSEKRNALGMIFKNHGYGNLCNFDFLSSVLDRISQNKNSDNYKNTYITLQSDEISQNVLNKVISEYKEFLIENGKIDFDDMILLCLEKLSSNNEILSKYRKQFKYIMVDEFQDINKPQYDLLRLLSMPENNIFVVGDDDQAIYGFRGSTPNVMQKFMEDFPNAKNIYLTDNYRSCANIISLAAKVIGDNKTRIKKVFNPQKEGGNVSLKCFKTRKDEEEYLYKSLRDMTKEEVDNTAIILRTNREVALYSSYLKSRNIQISEVKKPENLFNSKEMEDVKAFLRFLYEGSKRQDFIVFMNKPNIYLQRAALIGETINMEDVLKYYRNNLSMQNTLNNYFKKIVLAKQMPASLAVRLFYKSMGYEKYVLEKENNVSDLNMLKDKLQEILRIFENYKGDIGIDSFIEKIQKEYDGAKQVQTISSGVKIMTMHASKGLEFENVILPDINEGLIPAKNMTEEEVEEERRLFYVAITRTISNLTIIYTKERNREASRFIKKHI